MLETSQSAIDAKRKQRDTVFVIKSSNKQLRFPHPGEILHEEFLEPMGISQYRLALNLKIPHSRVTAVIHGRRAISPDTALRLSRYFGTSAEFWLGHQKEYDLRKARAESGAVIEKQVAPLVVAA